MTNTKNKKKEERASLIKRYGTWGALLSITVYTRNAMYEDSSLDFMERSSDDEER